MQQERLALDGWGLAWTMGENEEHVGPKPVMHEAFLVDLAGIKDEKMGRNTGYEGAGSWGPILVSSSYQIFRWHASRSITALCLSQPVMAKEPSKTTPHLLQKPQTAPAPAQSTSAGFWGWFSGFERYTTPYLSTQRTMVPSNRPSEYPPTVNGTGPHPSTEPSALSNGNPPLILAREDPAMIRAASTRNIDIVVFIAMPIDRPPDARGKSDEWHNLVGLMLGCATMPVSSSSSSS
jgi:hypothetical protein